jgi:hypothetical protein
MSEPATTNIPSSQSSADSNSTSVLDSFAGTFSNKNLIIIVLLVLVILSLIGINLLALSGRVVSDITTPIVPAFKDLLSMIGFITGNIINGSADLVANTANAGIDIAKGTTHSIGDLLIQSTSSGGGGADFSKQFSLSDAIGIPSWTAAKSTAPQPVQSSEPTVTSISAQKPKAGWCYVGDFSGVRGCVEVTEHDKCMSGQIFANQSECLRPTK